MIVRHKILNVHIWYYAISFPNGPSSQMVNIHADGQVLTDEFLMCRLLPVSIRLQGHPNVFGLDMVSG